LSIPIYGLANTLCFRIEGFLQEGPLIRLKVIDKFIKSPLTPLFAKEGEKKKELCQRE
jgi:hypothetical protein